MLLSFHNESAYTICSSEGPWRHKCVVRRTEWRLFRAPLWRQSPQPLLPSLHLWPVLRRLWKGFWWEDKCSPSIPLQRSKLADYGPDSTKPDFKYVGCQVCFNFSFLGSLQIFGDRACLLFATTHCCLTPAPIIHLYSLCIGEGMWVCKFCF